MDLKKIEDVVLCVLERNERARSDDFILYGSVLKQLGVPLGLTLRDFLSTAKECKYPSFESVSRARRHIYEYRKDLKNEKVSEYREYKTKEYKNYSRTSLGGMYE